MGLGLFPMILQTAVAIAFIWPMTKLSRVLDAYASRLRVNITTTQSRL
jgi:hypothetical protein